MNAYRVPTGKWAGFLLSEIPDGSVAALVASLGDNGKHNDANRCAAEIRRRQELGIWTGRNDGAVPKNPVPASESLFGADDEENRA